MTDQIEALLAAADSVPAPPRLAVRPEPPQTEQSEQSAPRVMIADDDSGFRGMLRDWLSDLGVTDVVEAADGARAVDLASKTHPDLILMDLRMPNMDGIEAARRVRSTMPSVQVVMLSAYGDEALQQAADEAGVFSYLAKGCSPDLLWQTIKLAQTYRLQNEQGSRVQLLP